MFSLRSSLLSELVSSVTNLGKICFKLPVPLLRFREEFQGGPDKHKSIVKLVYELSDNRIVARPTCHLTELLGASGQLNVGLVDVAIMSVVRQKVGFEKFFELSFDLVQISEVFVDFQELLFHLGSW